MNNIFENKVILLTGGTGSFGRKLTEIAIKRYNPKRLIVFSRDEMKQYEMRKSLNDKRLRYFIGDIRDPDRLHRAFCGVDIVVHAAALKNVPTAEYNPFEAVNTNIIGAENVINVAIDNGIKKVIALSTDKAANPVNLYGATKLCAEKMFIAANNYSPKGSKFSVVRYGNVFGSRGSVVPFFKECRGKKIVPITDPEMTRFWIMLEQGVNFVIQCIHEMSGGEVFVPKIPSMKITNLAKAICPRSKQEIIGIRPGEKLHETLISKDDGIYTYEYKDKYIIYPNVIRHVVKRKGGGKLVGFDFEGYTSNNNSEWLSVKDLREIAAKE